MAVVVHDSWEASLTAAREECGSSIDRHHAAIEMHGRRTLAHAYLIGVALRDRKNENSSTWLDRLPFGETQAKTYLRFACRYDDAEIAGGAPPALPAGMGVESAIKALSPPPVSRAKKLAPPRPDEREDIPEAEIGGLFGIQMDPGEPELCAPLEMARAEIDSIPRDERDEWDVCRAMLLDLRYMADALSVEQMSGLADLLVEAAQDLRRSAAA